MPETLVIVPARGGSRRLPGKNLRALGGRTLLAWTAEALREAGLNGAPVLLSTDDEAIAAEGKRLGWQVPFRRPAALAADDAPTVPTILHALDWYCRSVREPEAVMVLQPTSPFRSGIALQQGLRLLARHDDADAVIGVRTLGPTGRYVFSADDAGRLRSLAASDDGGAVYVPNGALYLIRTPVLRERESMFPPRMRMLVMDEIASIDIDTVLDWRLAELVARDRGNAEKRAEP